MTETAPTAFLIAGLGNPGRRFRGTRHNIGFSVLDALAREMDVSFTRHQAHSLVTDGRLEGARVYLAKPQTFMNLAGSSVGPLARYYRILPEAVAVVFDDLDLPLGTIRLRGAGGSGGHRGMESIISALSTEAVPRLRVGIGRPPGQKDPADFVLETFRDDEGELVATVIDRAVDCLRTFVREGIDPAMTRFNPASS